MERSFPPHLFVHLEASRGTAAGVMRQKSNTLPIGEGADFIWLPGRLEKAAGEEEQYEEEEEEEV